MKVLRKNDEFRRMPEKGVVDAKAIQSLINMGWNYSPKKAMKDFTRGEVVKKKEVVEEVKNTVETVAKAKTTAKERRAGEQKKLTTKK